jgi:hypothetical protein
MATYPTLRIGVLQSIVELKLLHEQDPSLLRDSTCPYDVETITALEQLFKTRVVEKIVEKIVEKEARGRGRPTTETKLTIADQELVEDSATELLGQLKELGEGEKGLDTQTKIQIIKTKATLIEQLLKLRERWHNVKRVALFQAVVIGVLDDLLLEADRDEFLKRIAPYRE